MKLDKELFKLLSEVSKDMAVAFLVAVALISPFSSETEPILSFLLLTKNIIISIVLLMLSWQFAKMQAKYDNSRNS